MTPEHLAELQRARLLLEQPSLLMKISDAIGQPLEKLLMRLPESWQKTLVAATDKALHKALEVALKTLSEQPQAAPRLQTHRWGVAALGALGGFQGWLSLPIELPATTTVMLRSIAEIARAQGEDLSQLEPRLACLSVLGMGGNYFAARTSLSRALSEAVAHVAGEALVSAPPLLRLVAQIALRFQTVVSEKALATAVPVIGAAAGATVNAVFMQHFQNVAEGHFTLRRLERIYGEAVVRGALGQMEISHYKV